MVSEEAVEYFEVVTRRSGGSTEEYHGKHQMFILDHRSDVLLPEPREINIRLASAGLLI
jgi:hypothetical protein